MGAVPAGKGLAPEAAAALSGAAADLHLLCRLHDREPDDGLLGALAGRPSRDWFALRAEGEDAEAGHRLIDDFWEAKRPIPPIRWPPTMPTST